MGISIALSKPNRNYLLGALFLLLALIDASGILASSQRAWSVTLLAVGGVLSFGYGFYLSRKAPAA